MADLAAAEPAAMNERAVRMQLLADLAKTLGTPGGTKLYQAAKRRGLRVTKAEVKDFISRKGQKQIFRPVQPSKGRAAAEGPRTRFQMDLIDLKFDASRGFKNVLVLVNVFTRQAYAANVRDKKPAGVASALEGLLNSLPAEPIFLSSDLGAEFTAEVQTLLEARGITHRVKMDKHDPNSLAVVDRVIQNLKLRYSESLAEQPGEWADRTAQIVREYNSTEHETLHGEPPDDVMDSDLAKFMLDQDNARKLKHNQDLMENRKKTLQQEGAFRRPIGGIRKFQRNFRAKYGDVEQIQGFEGSMVVSAAGKTDVKRVLPVDKDSGNVVEGFALGEGRNEEKRQKVFELAQSLVDFLSDGRKSMEAVALHWRREFPNGRYEELLRSIRASRPSEVVDLFPEFERSRDGKYVERA